MIRFNITTIFLAFCCLSIGISHAEEGAQLFVTGNLINVRSEPSLDSEILLKLNKDRKVFEIQRQQNWVQVKLNPDGSKTGWIHASLLDEVTNQTSLDSPYHFEDFLERFNNQNEVIEKQNGTIFFTEATHQGKGSIELIATQAWLDSDIETRNNSLSELFKIWSKLVPVGSTISMQVLDEEGDQYTLMMR